MLTNTVLASLAFLVVVSSANAMEFPKGPKTDAEGRILVKFENKHLEDTSVKIEIQTGEYQPLADNLWRSNLSLFSDAEKDVLTLKPRSRAFVTFQFKGPGKYYICRSEADARGFAGRNCRAVYFES